MIVGMILWGVYCVVMLTFLFGGHAHLENLEEPSLNGTKGKNF